MPEPEPDTSRADAERMFRALQIYFRRWADTCEKRGDRVGTVDPFSRGLSLVAHHLGSWIEDPYMDVDKIERLNRL
jgi:hypothetical protein